MLRGGVIKKYMNMRALGRYDIGNKYEIQIPKTLRQIREEKDVDRLFEIRPDAGLSQDNVQSRSREMLYLSFGLSVQ